MKQEFPLSYKPLQVNSAHISHCLHPTGLALAKKINPCSNFLKLLLDLIQSTSGYRNVFYVF